MQWHVVLAVLACAATPASLAALNVFFLQRVSYRDVEGRRPEAVMDRNVAGFLLRFGALGCVTKNVPQVVVPKQTRRSKMAAERMVAKGVQILAADITSLAARG